MSAILAYLARHCDAMLRDIETLVRAASPSTRKALVDRCGRVLAELVAARLGVRGERIPQAEVGDHYRFAIGDGDRQVLLLAHHDTVWEEGRLAFRVEGSRAYGPGIFDMKGGIVQAVWALKALVDLGVPLAKRVVLLSTSDEEIGSPTSRALIEAEARNSAAVLVLEPAAGADGALKTARKGVGLYRLTVRGRAAHAGSDPDKGVSAVAELARQVLALEALAAQEKGTTINVGVVRGGTRSNVIPEAAEAEIDVRAATLDEARRVDAAIRGLKPVLPGATLAVTGGINRPPMERTAAIGALFARARVIAARLGFSLSEAAVGGASDGNFTAALGVPTLDGLGCVGDGAHAEHEHIVIDALAPRAALLAHLLAEL
ncbi:M20 family metallopeptidase [Calditerricola satsumensis]|uniref:Peptidase M20 n=2 Tax=Calditerricola satsumensis TaxID=373054 RepID=A0A8J3B3T5_9BACI|nr:M20 family metallopeptidase [Calditerricola satsumensis]GGJ91341.1 peptidase M20 [Calditerricola satsumensis]